MVPCLHHVRVMRHAAVISVSLLLAACPGELPVHPGVDADVDVDAPIGGDTGLTLALQGRQLPLMLAGGVELRRVYFGGELLRVITDADQSKTTVQNVRLAWTAERAPDAFRFGDAHPGMYSQVKLSIDRISSGDGSTDAFDLEGRVSIGEGDPVPFQIESDMDFEITVDNIDTQLDPGEDVTLTIDIDFAAMLGNVDFSNSDIESDGTRAIDDGNTQMPAIRAAIQSAFTKR